MPTLIDDAGTALYQRIMAYDSGHPERDDLMRRTWAPTPWMADVFTGGYQDHGRRERDIRQWCEDRYGPESDPHRDRPGRWLRGSATIHGWTWMGFASEAMLREFLAAWGPAKYD